MGRYDKITVTGLYLKEAPSGKAFLCAFHKDGKEVFRKWMPYSQAKYENGDDIVQEEYRTSITFTIPNWLAETEGLDEIFRDEILTNEYGMQDEYEEEIKKAESMDDGWGG